MKKLNQQSTQLVMPLSIANPFRRRRTKSMFVGTPLPLGVGNTKYTKNRKLTTTSVNNPPTNNNKYNVETVVSMWTLMPAPVYIVKYGPDKAHFRTVDLEGWIN